MKNQNWLVAPALIVNSLLGALASMLACFIVLRAKHVSEDTLSLYMRETFVLVLICSLGISLMSALIIRMAYLRLARQTGRSI